MSRLLLAPMLFLATCLPAFAAGPTLEDLHAQLRADDPISVVQALDADGDWDAVLNHIEAGEAGWILLIPTLAPGTDAGTAEGLAVALSRALKTNPHMVLSLIAGQYYSATDICLDNDIEVSPAEIAAFIDQALVAVAGILEPNLMEARNACLGVLGDARISALI